MIIDTHCHIDMYTNPIQVLNECERKGITVISMTSLPSHFELGFHHFKKAKRIRQALGYHPLFIKEYNKNEIEKFKLLINYTTYIGEIGLDFSKEGIKTKELQIKVFSEILSFLKNNNLNKIISLHSRGAEKEVLNYLIEYKIENAIFHWYSGNIELVEEILKAGYYFSINTSMIKSKKGNEIISKIPLDKLLVESDGPFIDYRGKTIHPCDLIDVYSFIAKMKNISVEESLIMIKRNFFRLLSL